MRTVVSILFDVHRTIWGLTLRRFRNSIRSVYANEFDQHAAHWLSCLPLQIDFIDERSIKDVTGNDVSRFTQCHFSPVSADGLSHSKWPVGQMMLPFGPEVVHVSHSVPQESERASKTTDTSGRSSGVSLTSAALQQSLESKLRQRMEGIGCPMYALTWKHWLCCWLMGYPDEWLSCVDWETRSSPKSRRSSSRR